MKSTPRTLKLVVALLLACGIAARAADAQQRGARTKPQTSPVGDSKQTSKAASGAKARARLREKQRAVAVLLEVAGDAREIEELFQRASVLSSCADALWEADQQSARTLFRRAWEAATESDDAELKEEKTNGRYGDLPERFTRARDLSLTTAARRDARMGETFLRSLTEWLESHESSARDLPEDMRSSASRDIGPLNESTQNGQRLSLAFSLLDKDSYKSALVVAEPALADGVSGTFVEFLLRLRDLSASEADNLYLRLLERTRADARSDANDVLILSTYALTPRLLAVVDSQGSIQFRTLDATDAGVVVLGAPSPSRRARAAFFDTAAAILLRPAQLGATQTGGETTALYFATGRLLPFFEREAPQLAPALRARLSSLAAEIEAARRDALDSQMKTQRLTSENPDDPLRARLEELGKAGDSEARDHARIRAVMDASKRKLWDRARSLADGIENEESRQAARFVIGAREITTLSEEFADSEEDEDLEIAVSFAREVELSPATSAALRAYALAEVAELSALKGNRTRARALLNEAFGLAQQAENRTELRAAALLMVAINAAYIDSARTWEATVAAVAALNEDKELFGNVARFESEGVKYFPGEREALYEAFRPYTVEELFDEVARKDPERAVAEARNLKNGFARALALVAAARAALEKSSGNKAAGAR